LKKIPVKKHHPFAADCPISIDRSRRSVLRGLAAGSVVTALKKQAWARPRGPALVFCCSERNDALAAARGAGFEIRRFDTPVQALTHAEQGCGVLLLAESYPEQPLVFTPDLLQAVRKKPVRVFAEYTCGPFSAVREPKRALLKRAVVTGTKFGPSLPAMSLLSAHNCYFLDVSSPAAKIESNLALAEVAGFDQAVFGLPSGVHPLLFEYQSEPLLLASTKLSNFVTGRYGPTKSWETVWAFIFEWLSPAATRHVIEVQPAVRPSWNPGDSLTADAEATSFRRGVNWYFDARLLIGASWEEKLSQAAKFFDNVATGPSPDMESGNGTLGILEGHSSQILPDGSQPVRWWVRADCVAETAMVMAVSDAVHGSSRDRLVAANLLSFLRQSIMANGVRADPKSQTFGLLGWNTMANYHHGENGYDVYYGDDNARSLLGIITASALLKNEEWQERMWMAILANLRLLGTNGQQLLRYDEAPLEKNGWRHYYESPTILYDMNYQAYPWALFLWAYSKTGFKPFLERTYTGIRDTMVAYPLKWKASDSITSSQARLLLPLAWLVRLSPSAETRSWLNRIGRDLISHQANCGAIQEWFQPVTEGTQGPPQSNEQYGTAEGPIIQRNGDPAADLLYTNNFALIGLHEAYAATADPRWLKAEDRLASFVTRAQVKSSTHPELNGAWFRAFDFKIWDYWASNSDSGWGAWCTETGWSQSWLTTALGLRQMRRSLWDVASTLDVPQSFHGLAASMFPDTK
jgi:hypothetical protein